MNKQIKSILESIESFHSELSAFYSKLETKTDEKKTKILLDFISRQEKDHENSIKEYIETAPTKILDSWIKDSANLPKIDLVECINSINLRSSVSTDDVTEIALKFDDCIIKFYEALINESPTEDLKEVFTSLYKKSKKQEMNLSRDLLWLSDV